MSNGTQLPIPSFAFSCVESTKFSSARGTSRAKGDQPLHTSAAIFSPQGNSAKSKMSTGQGPLALLPLTRQHAQAPCSLAAAFLG